MTGFLLGLTLLLAIGCVAGWIRVGQLVAKHQFRGLFRRWPIPEVKVHELDPVFETTPLGPSPATAITFVAGHHVPGGISDLETWILCVLTKQSQRVFEFGTCTGKTTYLLAANCPDHARVTTLTLDERTRDSYRHERGDGGHDHRAALRESVYSSFYYSGTPMEARIEQLFGDSKQLDDHARAGQYDLVFVDGSHARSYVESDSQKAIRMTRPGGRVVWHDYRGPRNAPGVFSVLNALARELPLRHIAGTSMVVYQKPRS